MKKINLEWLLINANDIQTKFEMILDVLFLSSISLMPILIFNFFSFHSLIYL